MKKKKVGKRKDFFLFEVSETLGVILLVFDSLFRQRKKKEERKKKLIVLPQTFLKLLSNGPT